MIILLSVVVCVLAVCCYLLLRSVNQLKGLLDNEAQTISSIQETIDSMQAYNADQAADIQTLKQKITNQFHSMQETIDSMQASEASQAEDIILLKNELTDQLASIRESAELIDSGSQALAMTQDHFRQLQEQINDLEEKISFLAVTRPRK